MCRQHVGRPRRVLARDVELLAVVDAVVGQFGADALPATEPRRVRLVDPGLRLLGQCEERLQRAEVAMDELCVDPVIDEREEADLVADGADLVRELATGGVTRTVDIAVA